MGVFWLPHVPTRGAGKMAEIAGLSRFLDDHHSAVTSWSYLRVSEASPLSKFVSCTIITV